jgi:hypothetical protein
LLSRLGEQSWTKVGNYSFSCLEGSGASLFGGGFGGAGLSTNNGISWNYFTGLTGKDVRDLMVVSSGDIYAGTENAGIFRSTDNGTNWSAVNAGLTKPAVAGEARVQKPEASKKKTRS